MPSFKFASATGSGSSLIVTCSDQFVGKTITCTNGTKTYTRTCPSTSPYQVVFKGIAPGTWTVSGVVEGQTYSQQVVITDFDVILITGFDYMQWITLGGLDPTDYTDLEDVFADEVAVRRLMTIHASADYLIEKVTDDIDVIDDFTANDTAMKWIGLRDYVCDGLTAITGVEAKFLASEYWERYLKDHVPVMTSNTAPYGTARASSEYSGLGAFRAFDNNIDTDHAHSNNTKNQWVEYKFTNPICVKKVLFARRRINDAYVWKICASNDGINYVDIKTDINTSDTSSEIKFEDPVYLDCNDYYLYWRLQATDDHQGDIRELQFYGRSLNVSVPVMTSNTAPYGEASASAVASATYAAYKAFDNSAAPSSSSGWVSGQSSFPQWVQYAFTSPVSIKRANIIFNNINSTATIKISASNDNSNFIDLIDNVTVTGSENKTVNIENDNSYLVYRLAIISQSRSQGTVGQIDTLQFYGVDYSEREFAEGSTMKYLYDHGVEFEELDSAYTASVSVEAPTKEDTQIYFATAGNAIRAIGTTNKLDLTDYSFLRMTDGDKGVLGSSSFGGLQVLNAKNTSSGVTSQLSLATMSAMTGNQTLNISSLNTEYYVTVYSGNSSRQYSFKELWLE